MLADGQAGATRRVCRWCNASLSIEVRRDAQYCSTKHRQAAWRFRLPSLAAAADGSVSDRLARRFAYADPPYPGMARRLYRDHPDYAGEVDHVELLSRLGELYDGWALSTSAAALPDVLRSCPTGVRVAAWFRGPRPTRSYTPLSAWEPVIYYGSRRDASTWSARRVDALIHVARPRLTDPRRVVGAKPAAFCAWLFTLLGLQAADELVDLFPGSGGVASAWETYRLEKVRLAGL